MNDPFPASAARRAEWLAGATGIVVGVLGLIGWATGRLALAALLPGEPPIKADTAVAFVLIGAAVVACAFLRPAERSRLIHRLPVVLGLIAAAIGVLTLVEYVAHADLGIDQLLVRDASGVPGPPGRISLPTSSAIVALGIAVALVGQGRLRGQVRFLLGVFGFATGGLILVAYAYGSLQPATGFGAGTAAAPAAMFAAVALSFGVLACPEAAGPVTLLLRRTDGGRIARLIVAAAAIGLPIVGWLRVVAQDAGLIDARVGAVVTVAAGAALVTAVGIWTAAWLDRAEGARYRAERARIAAESEVNQLFDTSPDLIAIAGADGSIRRANPAWQVLLGQAPDAITGQPMAALVHPDDAVATRVAFEAVTSGGALPAEFANRLRHADGSYRTVEWSAARPAGAGTVHAIGRDVTERLEAERTRAILAAVITSVDAAIMTASVDGIITSWNPAATRLFSCTADEAVGRPLTILWPPDVEDEGFARLREVAAGASIGAYETVRHRDDGTRFAASVIVSPVVDVAGRVVATSWITHDTSALAAAWEAAGRSEAARVASEERFRASVESIEDAFAIYEAVRDDEGELVDMRCAFANRPAEALTGHPRDELIGSSLLALWPNAEASRLVPRCSEAIRTGEAFHYSVSGGRSAQPGSGVQPGSDAPQPSTHDLHVSRFGDGVIISARDVTTLVTAVATLQRLNRELGQRNKDLRDFASVVSHDLRAPLRRLQLFAERLLPEGGGNAPPAPDVVAEYAERIRAGAARLDRLVSDLLLYARLGDVAATRDRVDLDALVRAVCDDLEPEIRDAGTSVDIGDLPLVEGNATLLRQLFANLIGNAIKFRRAGVGHRITVEGHVRDADDPTTSEAEIVISDNGIGFDDRFADRIFEIFERLHPEDTYPGTGIGLAICRKVVMSHGGTIEAHGTPGEGATFTIRLPVRDAVEPAARASLGRAA